MAHKKQEKKPLLLLTFFLIFILVISFLIISRKQPTLPNDIHLVNNNLDDKDNQILIAEKNKLYEIRLDGSLPQVIYTTTTSDQIGYVEKVASSSNVVIALEAINTSNPTSWILKNNQGEETLNYDPAQYPQYYRKFINQQLTNTIWKDSGNGKLQSIGSIPSNYQASGFIASFDENYLLNGEPGGGKPPVPMPAYVYDVKTGKVINISPNDLDYYGGYAMWINNNKILASGQKIITVNNDSYTVQMLKSDPHARGYGKISLSPSKKLLANDGRSQGVANLAIFDLDSQTNKIIQTTDENGYFDHLGWSQDSNKFVYAIQDTKNNIIHVYIYDLQTAKNTEVVNFAVSQYTHEVFK